MKRLPLLLSLALMVLVLIAACSHDPEAATFRAMPSEGWLYGDSIVLVPVPADTAGAADATVEGRLLLSVRHDNSYRYANLWVEVSMGSRLRDTIEIRMADAYGTWYGRSAGTSISLTDTVARRIAMHPGDRVAVRHIMRPDTLRGIERVGIIFKPFDYDRD